MKQRHPLARRACEFHAVQKPQELSELLWLVEEHPPRSVLEIGTFAGGTLYCLCRLAQPDATIVSVDKPIAKLGGLCPRRLNGSTAFSTEARSTCCSSTAITPTRASGATSRCIRRS
jgi:hypothetical protein